MNQSLQSETENIKAIGFTIERSDVVHMYQWFVFFLADASLEDMWHKGYGCRVPFSCNEKRGRQL